VTVREQDAETMEKLRQQVENLSNEGDRLGLCDGGRPEGALANPLPMELGVYRKCRPRWLPLAPALIKRRWKQGKEDPERVGERARLIARHAAAWTLGVDPRPPASARLLRGGADSRASARASTCAPADLAGHGA